MEWKPKVGWREFGMKYIIGGGYGPDTFPQEYKDSTVIAPCRCDYELCEGWGKVFREMLDLPENAWINPADIHEWAELLAHAPEPPQTERKELDEAETGEAETDDGTTKGNKGE